MKKAKIVIIVLVVLVVLGAVFLKYVKPKLDERKEAARLKEAEKLATASLSNPVNSATATANLSAAMPTTTTIGVGGIAVESN